ncbi:hypothetical protein [Neisseria meningitidis]|uniref:hypothetical protein n=1 Tax=Neisseria meningitidis TaxID=487 RepID=UPI001641360D|nr:hypothetical protein [Neisseria meningitidis]
MNKKCRLKQSNSVSDGISICAVSSFSQKQQTKIPPFSQKQKIKNMGRRVGFSPPIPSPPPIPPFPPFPPHQGFLANRRDSAVSVFGEEWRIWRERRRWWDWWAEAHPTSHLTSHLTDSPYAQKIKNAV